MLRLTHKILQTIQDEQKGQKLILDHYDLIGIRLGRLTVFADLADY